MSRPTTQMQVPLLDLRAQYRGIRGEVLAALERVCESQQFILGREGEALERELAAYCGARHAVGCASGTDALLLCLLGLELKPGEAVVTPAFGFISTVTAVLRAGGRAVFADVDPRTYDFDPASLERGVARAGKLRAFLPVHLFGQPALDAVGAAVGNSSAPVIEDAAQAIGAEHRGRRVGGIGWAGCFSFYPTKNLGGYGDGGLITTNDDALASRLRALRHHGSAADKYHHEFVGLNSRLDELQAAVLRVKLKYLEEWTQARQEAATRYDQLFAQAGLARAGAVYPDEANPVVLPHRLAHVRHVFHQYVVRARERDALRKFLAQEGVGTEIYYPVPLHLQACFRPWGGQAGDFPEAERAAAEVLALPLFPELTAEMQQYVVDRIAAFYRRGA